MLIFSITDNTPMIYTGSAWENFCTSNVSAITVEDYFLIKKGIPCIPSLITIPSAPSVQGELYYSKASNVLMVNNGIDWLKITEIASKNFTESLGFSTRLLCKIPVLNVDPVPVGLTAGAFYVNSITKSIRYYDGLLWENINCGVVISTTLASNITSISATSGGEITNTGGMTVTFQGICYGTSVNPTNLLSTKTIQAGTGIGTFTGDLTDLFPNTVYHVRAYAITSTGVFYGSDKTFKTNITSPTIITALTSEISNTTAFSGGSITSDGGAQVTTRGIIWSTTPNPQSDVNAIKTLDGSGVGEFPSKLNTLLEKITYYIQAYAINSFGTSYGNVMSFTAPPAVSPVLNSSDSFVSSISDITAVGEVDILNNGGSLVTERGIMVSTDSENFIAVPSTTINVTDIGKFLSNLNGLSSGITYYIKGYATNNAGTTYGSISSFMTASYVVLTTTPPTGISRTSAGSGGDITNSGQATISLRGVCWSTMTNPTTLLPTQTSQTITGNGTGNFSSYISGLTPNTVYYIRAYAINSHGISYGDEVSMATIDFPTVTTTPVSSFTSFTANGGGNVTDDGRSPVTQRGVCWGPNANPAIGDGSSRSSNNGQGTGIFTSNLTNITPNITYHMRAYAINELGTVYGEDMTFFLLPTTASITTLEATNITNNTAIAGGNLVSSGGTTVTDRGIIWGLMDPLTDPAALKISNGTFSGSVSNNLTGLVGNTTYFVRAYAVNILGTAYGELVQFTTLPITVPIFSSLTLNITNITNNSAAANFAIISNGGSPVTSRGITISTDRISVQEIPATVVGN